MSHKSINILDKSFAVQGEIALDFLPEKVKTEALHQVMEALRAKKRSGTASTKRKSEVRGGGAKPMKQKGSGRARQGSTRSPMYPGGGVAFGPHPRSFEQKVNKKVMVNAIKNLLLDKVQAERLLIFKDISSTGKTQEMNAFLKGKNIHSAFIILDEKNELAFRSMKNLVKIKPSFSLGFNVYDALKYEYLIFEEKCFQELTGRLQ